MADSPEPTRGNPGSTAELLRRRDAILGGVARATERISQASHWRDFMNDVLRIAGEATGVSRVYVFDFRHNERGALCVYQIGEWAAPGVTPQIDNPDLQGVEMVGGGFGRWMEHFERGEPIVGDIAEFPPEEQPILEAQQILSLLVQPIYAGPRLWGMIGFDACERPQHWAKVEVDALRIAAVAFGAAVQREEREAMLQAMQRLEALGRMAGGIAHDFNNVLTVASGSVELLLDSLRQRGALASTDLPLVEAIQQALTQGTGLTRRLLQFSRQREDQPQDVDVFDSLRGAMPLIRQLVGRGVQLDLSSAPNVPKVRIDPVQLEQVLLNLAVNARDAMSSGGALSIRVDSVESTLQNGTADSLPVGRWVKLAFRDNGCGMTSEVRERIFEPFFTTKSADRGTGLGLSTVFAVVNGCGGRIAVSSTLGSGSEFRLYFPALARA